MILKSIEVANWRCLLEPTRVGPFDDGLNVIHGPNGTGKTTLFEALRLALLDAHRVTCREAEGIRPWGRDLAPTVTVEFVHDGVEYRVAKQFLSSPRCRLERKEDGRYRPLADGTAADDMIRSFFTKNPPGRGLARRENWGLAQVLWAPQGSLALANLSGDLVADIHSMLSTQVAGAGTGPIEKKIEERYLEFFTPTGKAKAASSLTRAKERLDDAAEDYRKANDLYLAFEKASRKVEDLQACRAQARQTADELARLLAKVRDRAEAYRTLLAEKQQHAERAKSTEAQYNELRQRIEIIAGTGKELEEARSTVVQLDQEAPLCTREVNDREREAAKAKAELEDARKGRQAVDAAEHLAEAARRFTEATRRAAELDGLIGRITSVQSTLAERKAARAAVQAPDARQMRAIRKAAKERDDAQVKIDASLITLEIVPESAGSVDVLTGEQTGPRAVEAGQPLQIKGSPEVAAQLPGVARLRAWGPTGSIDEHRREREKAEKKINELTAPFGTSNPDELEAVAEKAKELDAAAAEAQTKLDTLLAGRQLDALVQDRAAQETAVAALAAEHPEWRQSPPDAHKLKSQADDAKRSFIAGVESAEAGWDKTQGALAAVRSRQQTMTQRLDDARKRVVSLAEKLADSTKDGKSPQERDRELQQHLMAWNAAKTLLAEVEGKIAGYGDDPLAAVGTLEAQLKAALAEAEKAREDEVRQAALLENISAQGPYSALAQAEEKAAQLKQEVGNEELRADAIRLLRDTVAACRKEAIAAVTGPVEAAATRMLQRIAGRRLGCIRLGQTFEPSSVVPDAANEPVELDDLSGGEKEQLYLVTRLALADVLRGRDRQLVVLDDVLTATDSGRLARVVNVLEEAAQRLQIVVLTCHPERYRGLRGGRFFDLEAIAAIAAPGQ